MKRFIFFMISLLFLGGGVLTGQTENCDNDECLTNVLDISTGYNHANGTVFSTILGTQDPYWILSEAPTNNGPVNIGGPAFVINSIWAAAQTGSQYISAFQTAGSNAANTNQNLPPYSFERCFCVCDEGTVLNFDISVHVDNQVQFYLEQPAGPDIYLDGLPTTSTSNFSNPADIMSIAPITTTAGGQYCLRAEVRNDNQGSPMGLNVSGTITSEIGIMLTEVCCATDGFITGYKYEDLNCDGEVNNNDPVLPNWTIELLSQSGQVLQTTTTDVNGYYVFNAAPGSYIVQEVQQGGWSSSNPQNGIYSQVTVNGNDVINIDFLNCQSGCDGLTVSATSTSQNEDDCCWSLSYDNQQGDVYGLNLTALDGVNLFYDFNSIDPGLVDVIFSGTSVTLIPTVGGPLATGPLNDFIEICLNNINAIPQQVVVEWYDAAFEVVCDTTLEFSCEPIPECLYNQTDTIYCNGADVIYEFTFRNPASAFLDVGRVKIDVISPAAFAGVIIQDPAVPIPPGGSWSSSFVIPDGYQYAGEDLCYNIYSHEGPDELYCCFDSTLYCIPIPECPPCDSAWVNLTPLNQDEPAECCYRLGITNHFDDMYFDNIQTTIITPGVTFSDINFPLPHTWSYTNLVYHQDLMWSYAGGGFIPEVTDDFLMDFCLEGITTTAPVEIVVNWFANDSIVCMDTLLINCNNCLSIEEEEIVCNNGNYEYYFSFYNNSGFTVNAVKFVEIFGEPDFINEDLVFLDQDYPSYDGQLISVGPIQIDGAAYSGSPDSLYCFHISLRYERPEDSLSIECCQLIHCIDLPDCPPPGCSCDELEMDVACGISVNIDCYNLTLIPDCLIDQCDELIWTDDAGTNYFTTGSQPLQITVPGPGLYTYTILIIRMDDNGIVCEFQTDFSVDVPICVDPNCIDPGLINNDPCILVFDPVCGCDGIDYSNSCFAMQAGNTTWTQGACPPIVVSDTIILDGGINVFPAIGLNWQALTTQYAFFSVRRRLSLTSPWFVLEVTDGNTFETEDPNTEIGGDNEYQVIGTTAGGYAVYSNIILVPLPEPPDDDISLYPVPAIQDIILKVPVGGVYDMEIMDTNGRQLKRLKQQFTAEGSVPVDISYLDNGVYLMRMRNESGKVYVKQFVKMK